MALVEDLLAGNRRALARTITRIENEQLPAEEIAALFPHTGRAHLVGITGAPGTGKSTLVNQLALHLRRRDYTVAILAVDPTSPFTGGAILGDRIRMRDLAGDPGVFIRSMASRGSLGGLARTTADVIKALDAAGFDIILIETVGAGQAEVDIARHAHTILVVEAPGLGDDVQAIKAGILEIADILVVNKADDPRAKNTETALKMMLELSNNHPAQHRLISHHGQLMTIALPSEPESLTDEDRWQVCIQPTVGLSGEGVSDLLDSIFAHKDYLHRSGELARRDRARLAIELDRALRDRLLARLLGELDQLQLAGLLDRIIARQLHPQLAANLLIEKRLSE